MVFTILLLQLAGMFITLIVFGLYRLTADASPSPVGWLIGGVIPILNFIFAVKMLMFWIKMRKIDGTLKGHN